MNQHDIDPLHEPLGLHLVDNQAGAFAKIRYKLAQYYLLASVSYNTKQSFNLNRAKTGMLKITNSITLKYQCLHCP